MTVHSDESQPISPIDPHRTRSEERAVTRAAGVVGFWTTLSRILGFVRDMVIAIFMGAGLGADAFFVAFRIPNLLRRLFAEGALSAAFVPTFVEVLQKDGRGKAEQLARVTSTAATIALAIVTILGIAFSPWLVKIIAPGFTESPEKFSLTVALNRIMFPYIFFISLVALASGVLNAVGYFGAPAASPIVLNLSMIFSVALCCSLFGIGPAHALSWGVFIAGVLQLALQVPFMEKARIRLRPDFSFGNPALKRIGRLFVPAAFSGAVYQVNVVVGTILASMLPVGSVSWLYYADRLVELPLGVFAIPLGTAVLPSMSRLAGTEDMEGFKRSLSYALRLTAFFIIPASVGLILLREPIIALLFQRGQFTHGDTQQTADALLWYTAGLWAFSGLKIATQSFFSLKDTSTPLWISIAAVAVNLIGGLLLMRPMRHGGLALATSLAAAFNVCTLYLILARRLGGNPAPDFLPSTMRISAASAIMGLFLVWARGLADWGLGLTAHTGLILVVCVGGGTLLFALAAYVLRCPELRGLLALLKGRTGPSRGIVH
ncbi:MAG: murein biosynthesis integral membrane protein MurJ [Desulfomonile sp.]|nr:murein biosynthesis integral membrane protein MurJ [Desulfomonile sp.]